MDIDVLGPWATETSHLPRGRRRARRTKPAVPHDTCPCSPASVACCSRPEARSPLPAAPPAPASPRQLPTSGSRWGYYHWSMSKGMKVKGGGANPWPKPQPKRVKVPAWPTGAIRRCPVVSNWARRQENPITAVALRLTGSPCTHYGCPGIAYSLQSKHIKPEHTLLSSKLRSFQCQAPTDLGIYNEGECLHLDPVSPPACAARLHLPRLLTALLT